jgi:tetratricopeptide (TPR) repeat protein
LSGLLYRDTDPYDLPEEFSHLQALDMGKLGFAQDLLQAVKKLTTTEKAYPYQLPDAPAAPISSHPAVPLTGQAEPLIRRAFLFLEDGEWEKTKELLEQALNLDPENPRAYVGKLLAETQIRTEEELPSCKWQIRDAPNYKKALRFADANYREILEGYSQAISDRFENARRENVYKNAPRTMQDAKTEQDCFSAAAEFNSISGYKDSDELAQKCKQLADEKKLRQKKTLLRLKGKLRKMLRNKGKRNTWKLCGKAKRQNGACSLKKPRKCLAGLEITRMPLIDPTD